MKSIRLICFATLSFLVLSCGNSVDTNNEVTIDPNELLKVEGGKFSGGVLKLNSIEDYTTLFPASINDIYSTHIAGQGYEGLLRLNQKTLEVEPCLAESFDIDNNKKVYTFHIRKGAKFADDECFEGGIGREIVADDFSYCFKYLCSNHKDNKWGSLFRGRVLGANEYGAGRSDEVSGIRVLDKYTLQLELINPYSGLPNLLSILATAVYPHEAIDEYGYDGMKNKIVGSGPFVAREIENGNKVVFVKNKDYWKKDEFGNQLPLLSQVEFSFIKDKNAELKAFQDEELDMIWNIPVEEIPNVMGSLEEAKDGKNKEFEVQSINSLNVQYYGFLSTSEVFGDVRIRRAFNYAIDRDSLVDFRYWKEKEV